MGETAVSAALSPPQTSVSDASRLEQPQRLRPPRVRIFLWLLAIALGAAQAWATRFTMNPDGISYLDMGDAYWRGNWHMAINAYFSPFYSWILGFFMKDRKSTRLNSSHSSISYAVFCLKKKNAAAAQ